MKIQSNFTNPFAKSKGVPTLAANTKYKEFIHWVTDNIYKSPRMLNSNNKFESWSINVKTKTLVPKLLKLTDVLKLQTVKITDVKRTNPKLDKFNSSAGHTYYLSVKIDGHFENFVLTDNEVSHIF